MAEPKKRSYGTVYDALKSISKEDNVDFGIDSYTKEQFRDKYFTGPGNIENLYNKLNKVSDEAQLDFGLGTRDEWLASFGYKKAGNGYQSLDGRAVGTSKPQRQAPAASSQQVADSSRRATQAVPDSIARPTQQPVQQAAWQAQGQQTQQPAQPAAPQPAPRSQSTSSSVDTYAAPFRQDLSWEERAEIERNNNFASQGVDRLREETQQEEERRRQPIVDTGDEGVNQYLVKQTGQWEDELNAGINELTDKWVRPQVDARLQEAKDAWSASMEAYKHAPAQAQLTMANENLDPDKILIDLQQALEETYNSKEMQRDIEAKANAAGIPVEDYVSQVVKPALLEQMHQYFNERELQEYLPKNAVEYIAQGLNSSIVGMLSSATTDSKGMRQFRNEAAAITEEGGGDYTPGLGAKLGQLAVSFTADSPFFGLYGKASGSLVKKVAEREIKKMMAKGMTEGAARNIVGTALENSLGKRMKNYLMSHIISSGTTLAGYNMTSESARQINAGEFKPGQILKSGAEGFATGTAFGATGAVTEALTQPLGGIWKVGAKTLGFGAEAETMYATEELAKLAQGDDAFTNPFEGTLESMLKLGVMKVSSPEGLTKTAETILHPVRISKRQHTGINFTKEEQELLRQSVEGSNFIRALSDMQAEVSRFDINQRTESNPELKAARERLARNYNEVMTNTEIPATLKEKLAAVSGGVYRRGLETGADIVHNADGSVVLMTRDKDGNCIQRLKFDSFSEADDWRDQNTGQFRINDAANTWNDMSAESRAAAVKRVMDEHDTDAEGAAAMITAALRGVMGADFADAELLNIVTAVTETAYPDDEPHTAHNYAEGRKMAPEDRRAAVRDVERAESKLTYWGQEYADEVMGAADNPDAKVAELATRDGITGEQVQAAIDYYNKRSKADGALDEALSKVDEQVSEANAEVTRNTHQETGKVVEIDQFGTKYYVTAGNIQISAEGLIDPRSSDKTIVVRNAETGEMRMLSPDRPLTVTSLSNPKDIVAANESMDGMRGQLLEEVSNSVSYAEGTPMEPTSGDVYIGRDGNQYVVLDTFNQESGTVEHHKVEVKPDGSFDYEKTLPFDLEEYRQAKSDEIEAREEAEAAPVSAERETPAVEEQPAPEPWPEEPPSAESAIRAEEVAAPAPEAGAPKRGTGIPTDEQGRPQYEQASVEDTKADLVGKYGDEITGQMVDQMVASSAKAVDDLEKQDLTGVTDMSELAQHYDDLIAARKKKEYWEQVRESLKAPEEKPAEPATEERPAEPIAEEKPAAQEEAPAAEQPAAQEEKPQGERQTAAEVKPATPAEPVEDKKAEAVKERRKKLEYAYRTSRHRKMLVGVLDEGEQAELLAANEKVERLRAQMAADSKSFTSYLNKKYAGEDMSDLDVRRRYNAEMDEHSRRWEEANGLLKAIDAESELVSRLSDKHMEDLFGAEANERTRIIGDNHGAKRFEKAKEAYRGTEAEALFGDDTPLDVYEFVSQNMPKNISWEDIEVGGRIKRGLASELGWKGTKRGIGRDKSTNAFNSFLAKKGEGISLQDAVHQLFTACDGKYSDSDIRNALLDMFLNASKPSDITDAWVNERISAAESIIAGAKEKELADYEEYLAQTGMRFSNKRRLNTPDAINRVYLARRREINRDLMDARWRLVREEARLQSMKAAAPEEGTMFPDVEADLSDANKERILKPMRDEVAYYERLAETNERERLKALRDARDADKRQTEMSFADRLEEQKSATDTNPSIAQKAAGNYRKGRLSFGGYDFVIENPKGSERSGVDAEGNEWSQEMNNTYGYIRGRKGRDGDAIDMFINDNADLDNWDGTVYVVDQVKPDGTFDEHKVMYGFGSEEEARQAYLSNYEPGWKGLGKITGVDKATFDKWLESSARKVKPFAEHATVLSALGKHPWGAEEEARRAPLRKRLDKWTGKGGIKVNIVESADEVSNAEALARIEAGEDVRGWFDTVTKEAYIYMPNIKDAKQLDRAFLHEVVSHKGLRSLLGDKVYNQLCDAVFDSMSYEARKEYLSYANVSTMGGLAAQRAAADEYMAHLAEDSSLSKSTWQKIVQWVKDKIRERFGDEELLVSDGDIEKLLRASYKNLRHENRERAVREISKETEGQMDGHATRMSTSSIIEGGGFKAGVADDDGNISPMTDKEGNMVIQMGDKTFSAKMPVTLRDIKADKNSALNIMLKFAVEDAKTVSKERADLIRQKYADIINMYLKAGAAENGGPEAGTNGKWLWLGETVFRTIATNGDKQYSYSADITRVCKKNEAVIRAISALQQAQGYGATPSQIMDIYEATRVEGYQVPCPVCYVFSRYLRNGKYASAAINGMRKYGEHLPGGSDPWTLEQWLTEFEARGGEKSDKKLQASIGQANEDISRLLKAIDRRGMKVLDPKTSEEEKEKLRKEIEQLDEQYRAALDVSNQQSLTNWIKTFAIQSVDGEWQMRPDARKPEDMKDFEDNALDIRRVAETMRKYPAIQRLRKSGGASAGKEITFESNNELGEVISGVGTSNPSESINWFKAAAEAKTDAERAQYMEKAKARFLNSVRYAQQQSLRGGQRMWSWSDNIEALSPDVAVNLMQMEMLGGALQAYSKQLEGVALAASMGGYVNGSLMAKDSGWREVTEDMIERRGEKIVLREDIGETIMEPTLQGWRRRERVLAKAGSPIYEENGKRYVLIFDDIIGIDPYGRTDENGNHLMGLFDLNDQYDRAGNIIVGMNDRHVRASMSDDRVFFIIPWHASGQSVHILNSMLGFLGTNLEHFSPVDYTKMQEEKNYGVKNKEGKYPKVPARLVNIWEKYRNESNWASGIGAIASGDGKGGLSKQQWEYRRLRDAIFDGTIDSDPKSLRKVKADEFLSQVYEKVKAHGGSMTSADKEFIYPYEYWDEKSTYDNADVNGERYLEYCRRLGFRPKFTGKWGDGNKWTNEGNFAEDHGYWKLLIDRRMYDRNGRFQDLTPTNSEGFTPDLVDPVVTGSRYVRTQVADPEGTRRIVGRVLKLQEERAELTGGGVPQANYDMTMREAVGTYRQSRSGIKITDADYQHKTYDDPEGGHIRLSVVTDKKEVERLEKEPKVRRYRAMAEIDGKLYPPMSVKVDGAMREPTEIGVWERSDETPFEFTDEQKAAMDALDKKAGKGDVAIIPGKLRYHKSGKTPYDPETGKGSKGTLQFRLRKDNDTDVWAAYNPYFHTSTRGMNDQFTSAYSRPNLVVAEVEIPAEETTNAYKAPYAKDSTGDVEWHSGNVNGALPKDRQRTVTLSRYAKVLRVVPDEEVAKGIAEQLEGLDMEVPFNVVTPSLRDELVKLGVKIGPPEKGNAGAAAIPAYEQWLEDGGNNSGKEGAVRFSIGKNGRQLQLFDEGEMTGGMIPREGNLFDQKNEEGRQVDMFEQAARISDEVEKDEAAATAASVVKETSSKIDDFGQKIGLARKDVAVSGIKRGKRSDVPAWRKKYQTLNVTEDMMNSKDDVISEQIEFDPSKPFVAYTIKETPWFRRMVPVKDKDGKVMLFRSQEEMESVLPVFEAASQGFKVKENDGRFEIVKRASTGKEVVYSEFDTKEEAETYLNSPEGATALLNHKVRNYEFPPLENLTRNGMKDWRQGRDITGQDMIDEFGFRGGEFGNWVSDSERQQFLNVAYDSLKDLADILGVSPRALSLGGALSIAFGARGHSKYVAHYEPGRAVINMTKMKGAGSLAHEWAHALDNYFGMLMAGLQREHGGKNERYATEEYYSRYVRPEVMEAFRDVVNAMKKKTVTRAKDTSEAQAQVDGLKKKLDAEVRRQREIFARGINKRTYNRSAKRHEWNHIQPSEEELQEFDRLIAELEKDPHWNWDPAKQGWRLTGENGQALYELLKKYGEDNKKGGYGPAHNVGYYLGKLKAATDYLNAAKAGESETVAIDTDFAKGSRRADSGRAGGYFAKTIEMFARAFETHLADKMAKAGKSSDYLTYRKSDIFKTLYGFSVYPEGEELKAISKAMDKLFETIDEKVDDNGNTVLFSVKGDDEHRTPIFQSNAARAVDGIRQEKATPEQWLKMIEKGGGMKAAEDKWTGLSDWLKGQNKKSLTKEEVMDYIRENQVQVEEVSYQEGGNVDLVRQKYPDWDDAFVIDEDFFGEADIYIKDFKKAVDIFNNATGSSIKLDHGEITPRESEEILKFAEDEMRKGGNNAINPTRLTYTTKGLENKKEIALTVPTIESWNRSDDVHFGDAGEGRAVAWVRFGDTTIPRKDPAAQKRYDEAQKAWDDFGGKMYDKYGADYLYHLNEAEQQENARLREETYNARIALRDANAPVRVLVIDEIQSKRHQEGREKGYREEENLPELKASQDADKAFYDYQNYLEEKYKDNPSPDNWTPEERAKNEELSEAAGKAYGALTDARYEFRKKNSSKVPAAPFEKNWHELAMKRMLRYAAENGYDKIAWTKGDQQADRYDLANDVKRIYSFEPGDYEKSHGEFRNIQIDFPGNQEPVMINIDKDGMIMSSDMNELRGKHLSDALGKELANKILSDKPGKYYDGEDLRVGGQGMKGFYDKILPSFMDKYGKKWGVKTGEVELPYVEEAGRKMWAVDVTPEMKESVTKQPQVMFSIGGERSDNVRRVDDMSDKDREQIRVRLSNGKAIPAKVNVITKRDGMSARNVAMEWARKNIPEPRTVKTEIGDLVINITSISDSLAHGFSQAKLDVIPTLIPAFENDYAVYIGSANDITGNPIVDHYFAYPVEYNGNRQYVFCRTREDVNTHRLYIHEVITGEDIEKGQTLQSAALEKPRTGLPLYRKIISDIFQGKDTNNSGNFQENPQKNEDNAENSMRFMTSGRGSREDADNAQALYETALANWKRRNGLPADAQAPTAADRPVHNPGDDVIDFARKHAEYSRQVALWQTAPKLEDYENRRREKQVVENAIDEARRYPESQGARMNVMEAELVRLRHAVSRQRSYDKATVKAVTDFAQEFMRQGMADNMTRGEMERVLSAVKNATGARDIKKHVDKVLDILVDSHLRSLDNSIWKMASVKALKQNAVGVEVQGRLELKGQRMIQAFRDAIGTKMSAEDLRARLGEIGDKMSGDREDSEMWEQEYEGVSIALQYVDNINGSRQEWENLRQQYKDAVRDYQASGRSYEAQQQLLDAINESMRENKMERIGLYQDIISRLGGNIEESREGAKAFVEQEKERVARIHTLANSDLAGKPMGAMRQSTKMSRLANGTAARFFLSPLATFEQMLRQFGSRNARGEGNLYNHFMRSWIDSVDREFTNTTAAKEELDAKAREVFGGKVERWSDLYDLVRKLPMAEVSIVDQGEPKNYKLTQGNLLYIYMADKMTDGAMKLRAMGITKEDVDEIKEMLDPRLVALGDWLQEDYLVRKRVEYNKVHERMFGAPMAAIENYFPIKVLADARYIEEDVGLPEMDLLPTTVTGSIIKRRRNSLPLDILNTDALSLAIEHVEDMEHWAATAEWNKDVNTLLSYTTFRNKVKNMTTVYGSGDQLWNTFKAAAQMAAGEYKPRVKPGSVDKTISNIAKGVTAAKISFRVYTAFKQTLSAPAFLHDVNLGDFVKYGANPYGSWKWAMENMPVFKKRWKSRQAGDTRLMDDPTDWKLWKENIVQLASRMGMSPNALVDGVTCAVGARSIYESRLKKYMKMGASEETAKRRALQDAEIGYNLTQQSSEGAFVSAIQKDRTLAANALSVFRNSSMSYTRQWVDAARNLKHRFEPGYKEDSIAFMTRQLQNDLGLDADQARASAEQEYARAGRHEVAKLLNFMFGVTFAWNLGASLPYLLIGDDDETKKQMLEDAAMKALFAGPTEGFASGNIYSDLMGLATNEQVRKAYGSDGAWGAFSQGLDNIGDYDINPLPLMADISRLIGKMKYDGYAASQEVFNICMQSAVGVNPQTFTDMWNACMDYAAPAWDGTSYTFEAKNMARAKEIALFFMRIANAPTSSWRNKYIDELQMTAEDAQKLPYDELAKRYAHYKHWKDVPVAGFFRSKEGREEKMGKIREQFDKAVEERMSRLTDEELQDNLERSTDSEERRKIAKIIHERIMGSGDDMKKPKTDWQRQYQKWMTYEDIRDAELLSKVKTEAKAAGDKKTVDMIGKTQKKITEIKKKLITGDQPGEEMMEQIRDLRRQALEKTKNYNVNNE